MVNGTSLGMPMNITGLVLTRRYMREHPDEVRRFLTAHQQAWSFCADPANESAVVNGQVEVPTGGQGGPRWWPTKVPTPGVRCVGGSVLLSVVGVGAACEAWQPKGEA